MRRFRAGVTKAVAVLGLGICSIAVAGQDAAAGESDFGGPGGSGWVRIAWRRRNRILRPEAGRPEPGRHLLSG